jgi:protoporphyrinogen oxidase
MGTILMREVDDTRRAPGAPPAVGIVGGGIMGVTLAYLLSRHGVACEIFEASPVLGGLAGPLVLPDGVVVDRFYHTILSSDAHLRRLCVELGIADRLEFKETRTAFYIDGSLYSMNSLVEFLRFRPLSVPQRLRLGLTVALAQLYRDWQPLERITVRDWLVKLGGRSVFDRLWAPMLVSKFDGEPDGIPATWMWSRLVRVKSTREGANQRERAGHLVGGYATLLAAMTRCIEQAGGRIHLRCPVQEVVIADGRAVGLRVADTVRPFSQVVMTMQGPVSARLLPEAPAGYREALTRIPYLGVVCALLVLDRPLTGTWTINIADPRLAITGIIETTSYIDPRHVGGHHLVYVPKYTAPGSRFMEASDEEVKRTCLEAVRAVVPSFSPAWVRYFLVHRERYVEPLHRIGAPAIPGVRTPVDSLYLVTTAQIYPALTNGESVTRHAARAVESMRADMFAARA